MNEAGASALLDDKSRQRRGMMANKVGSVAIEARKTRRMPITEQQAVVLAAMVAGDKVDKKTLSAAGYGASVSVAQALGSRALQTSFREAKETRQRNILTVGADVAYQTMIELMGKEQPPGTRFSAAKYMLDAAGHGSKDAGADRDVPLHEMTSAQLEAFITKTQAIVDGGGDTPVITVIEGDSAP